MNAVSIGEEASKDLIMNQSAEGKLAAKKGALAGDLVGCVNKAAEIPQFKRDHQIWGRLGVITSRCSTILPTRPELKERITSMKFLLL